MEHYLNRYTVNGPYITEMPAGDLSLVVVIPACNEPHLITTLEDLYRCETMGSVEVIVVINHAETASEAIKQKNIETAADTAQWIAQFERHALRFYLIEAYDQPVKKAGVGLARKTGMDEAVRRFASINRPEGVIVCLDADCRVDTHYVSAIAQYFHEHQSVEGCALDFAHPLDDTDPAMRIAIVRYELHLRYLILMQRLAGYPFAYHTVGSAMAVRAGVYCKVGGMNMRQAGEDFYFLHKVIERGAFGTLHTTTVKPAARISDRVPFGTGRAMMTQVHERQEFLTYHPQAFEDIAVLMRLVPLFARGTQYNAQFLIGRYLAQPVRTFLLHAGLMEKLNEIRLHTSSVGAFEKRFYRWFNAFKLIMYLHHVRDRCYANVPVRVAVTVLLGKSGMACSDTMTEEEMLLLLREKEKDISAEQHGSPVPG